MSMQLYYPMGFNHDSNRAGYAYAFSLSIFTYADFLLANVFADISFLPLPSVLLVEMFAVTLGQAVAALAPTIYSAAMTNPFLLVSFYSPLLVSKPTHPCFALQVIFSLFCGVTVPPNVMPSFFRSWLYHLDPFTYIIEGLVTNELHDLPIVVSPTLLVLHSVISD